MRLQSNLLILTSLVAFTVFVAHTIARNSLYATSQPEDSPSRQLLQQGNGTQGTTVENGRDSTPSSHTEAVHWYTFEEFNKSGYRDEFLPPHRWKRVGAAVDGLLHGVNSPYNFLYPVHAYANQFKYFQKAHENQISKIFAFLLKNGNHNREFVVDVGANTGWYTALSGFFGYHVYSIDPQPMCSAQRFAMAYHNNYSDHVHVIQNGISDVPTEFRTGRICNPKWDVTAADPGNVSTTVKLDTLFDVRSGDAVLVKIDTEGSEHNVIRSMRKALEKQRVKNIILEISTVSWRTDMVTGSAPLIELVTKYGFEVILFELKRLAPRQYRYPDEFRTQQIRVGAFTHQDISYLLNATQLQHLLNYHNKTNSFGHIWFTQGLNYSLVPFEERDLTYEETHTEGRSRCRVLKLVGHWHACTEEELKQLEDDKKDRREKRAQIKLARENNETVADHSP